MQYDEYLKRQTWKFGQPLQRLSANLLAKRIFAEFNRDFSDYTVLEVGSGTGMLGAELVKFGLRKYYAIEPNSNLAKLTKVNVLNSKVYECSLPNVPSELHNSFDLIIMVHVIEHAENGYVARSWIESCVPLLKDGGRIVIISPEIGDFKGYFWEIDWSHCFPTSCENLKQLLKDLHLEITRSKKLRFGSMNSIVNFLAILFDWFLPTKILNVIGNFLVSRPLGTGLKAAIIWGVTFVVGQKV